MTNVLPFLFAWCCGMTLAGLTASLVLSRTGRPLVLSELLDRRDTASAFLLSMALGPALIWNEALIAGRSAAFALSALLIANLWAVASGIVLIGLLERLS